MHQGTNVSGRCTARCGWEVEVLQEPVELHVVHVFMDAELPYGMRVGLDQQRVQKRRFAFDRGSET